MQVDKNNRLIIPNKTTLISNDNSFNIISRLGKGAFSNVYLVTNKDDDKYYALKVSKCDKHFFKQSQKEESIFKKLNNESKYIIHYYESFELEASSKYINSNSFVFVLEKFGINLYEKMKKRKNQGLHVKIIYNLCECLFEGLEFMHKKGIIHGDLKPENLVINNENKIKIIDLGSSFYFDEINTNFYIQSRYYRAPNCILEKDITYKIDYWSVGCIIYETILCNPLFAFNNAINTLIKHISFIDIPKNKINLESKNIKNIYNFKKNEWYHTMKQCLLNYINVNINRTNFNNNINNEIIYNEEEMEWIKNMDNGIYMIMDTCINHHYDDEISYKDAFDNLKFPPITTGKTIDKSSHGLIGTSCL